MDRFDEYLKTRAPHLLVELFSEWRPQVYRICKTVLRRTEDVDDAVQETFLRFLRQTDSIRGSPMAWLSVTATTVSVDMIRRAARQRRRERLRPLAESHPGHWPAHESVREHLDDALLTLDELSRRRIIDHFFKGIAIGEIAHREGVCGGTIRRRLASALADLAAALRMRGALLDK
jgi:RNA polymerase sigma factor (sigma-70 family)